MWGIRVVLPARVRVLEDSIGLIPDAGIGIGASLHLISYIKPAGAHLDPAAVNGAADRTGLREVTQQFRAELE